MNAHPLIFSVEAGLRLIDDARVSTYGQTLEAQLEQLRDETQLTGLVA